MSGRYSKNYSAYIRAKRHQGINGGYISERNWATIGGWQQLSPGKIPYYNYGNFMFTTNSVGNYQKRYKLNSEVEEFTYNDVKNASDDVNNVKPNVNSNDIRTYAYYGSAVELVRASIENIIAEFPAQIKATTYELEYPDDYDEENGVYTTISKFEGFIVSNPFKIDLYHDNITLGKYDNPLRFFSTSYKDYEINGSPIENYVISDFEGDNECPQNNEWFICKVPVITVTINNSIILKGYQVEGEIVFLTNDKDLLIKPKEELIEEYFNNLEGFEKQLLNRKSKPLYKNTFITPVMGKLDYKYMNKDYTWPSDGYCIDIESPNYAEFVQRLADMATIYDELWTDNLYKNMTHEAIKNFDWTYTRDYMEGEEQNNVDGGERMKKILQIYGRIMDDEKFYIDAIKNTNKSTYNGYNNMPDATLSDKANLTGWDITSTIPLFFQQQLISENSNIDTLYLDSYFLNEKSYKWYNSTDSEDITLKTCDINFMNRLLLSSKRISQSKGTVNSIEMVMALFGLYRSYTMKDINYDDVDYSGDYDIEERYYTTNPKGQDDIDKVNECNFNKSILHSDEEEFDGLPLKSFKYGDENYLIPYYDSAKSYDGNLYFQSKGGWGKTDDEIDSGINYMETLSYLQVVPNVSGLISINPRDVLDNEIFYVVDLSDFTEYYEATDGSEFKPEDVTHFFKLEDGRYDTSKLSSWKIMPLDEPKVQYIDSIVSINFGNNPHVGYGQYDCGQEFIEYMRKPFKYAIDEYEFDDKDYLTKANDIEFQLTEQEDNDKIKKSLNTYEYYKISNGEYEITNAKTYIPIENDKTFINSKALVLNFNTELVNNSYFKQYFINVILPYVMQVIPSTTILFIKGLIN